MRILIVTHFLGEAHPHGLERAVTMLANELVQAGDEVALATTWDRATASGSSGRQVPSLPSVPVYELPPARLDEFGLPLDASDVNGALAGVLDAWRPDVVHVTLLQGLDPGVVRRIQEGGPPVVLDVHSHEPGCPRLVLVTADGDVCRGPEGGRACVRYCFAHLPDAASRITSRARLLADAVSAADVRTACSSYLARWVSEICDVAEPAVVSPPIVAPPPVLPARLRATPATRGRLNVAVIGPVDRYKRPDVAVAAIAGARLGHTQLVLAGAVHDRALEQEILRAAAGVGDLELRITGAFEPAELALLLSDVDVLVVTSHCAETYSLAAREAWSRGVPVLASRLGALPDAVREGENGFTYKHDDPGELGALLRRIVERPDLLASLRDGAVRTPYVTAPQYAAAFRKIYAEVAGNRRDRPSVAPPPDPRTADRRRTPGVADPETPGRSRYRAPAGRRGDHAAVFSDIYARDLWRLGGESSSGPGSRLEHTQRLRRELPGLLSRLRVRRLLDIGCGDFNWLRETDLDIDLYVGVDVVFDVVFNNRLTHGGPRRQFLLRDVTRDPLPRADLVLCRDVLIHFPDDDLVRAMHGIVASGARHLLASTFTDRARNAPIELGQWRPVNLELPPLSLPPPVAVLVETPSETGYDDKRLALWDLRALRHRGESMRAVGLARHR